MDYPEDDESIVSNISLSSGGDSQGSLMSGMVSETTQDNMEDGGVVACVCAGEVKHLVRLVEMDQAHARIPPAMSRMWREGELCDVTLVADGVEFPAHRLVLASVSPYFRTLFGVGLTDSKSPTINMVNFSATILKKILKYIYEQEMCLDRGEELDVIVGLDYLQLVEGAGWLEDRCWALAETHLCHVSAVRTLAVAEKSRLEAAKRLAEVALEFITCHVEEVMEEKEHLFLSKNHLVSILDSREFKLRYDEDLKTRLVVDWVKADFLARKDNIWELSSYVNNSEILDAFRNILGCEDTNPPFKKIKLKTEDLEEHDVEDPIILLFEAGSYEVQYFDVVNSRWGVFAGADTPGNHDLFDGRLLSTDKGKIVFSAEAFDGGHIIKSIEMWPDRPKFSSFNQNLHKVFLISAGCLSRDEIFLHNGVLEKLHVCRRAVSSRLRGAGEVLHPFEHQPIISMQAHTRNCTLVQLDSACDRERKLLAIGGENRLVGLSKQRTVSMYYEDSARGGMVSKLMADMVVGRAKPAVAVMGGMVYVIGGDGGLDQDTTSDPPDLNQMQDLQLECEDTLEHRFCEVYNPVTDKWARIADLVKGLVRICGAGLARGRVVVVGVDNRGCVQVHEYNPCRDQWKCLGVRDSCGGGKIGVLKACVMKKPSWLVNKLKLMSECVVEDEASDCSGFHNKCFTESDISWSTGTANSTIAISASSTFQIGATNSTLQIGATNTTLPAYSCNSTLPSTGNTTLPAYSCNRTLRSNSTANSTLPSTANSTLL